MEIYAVCNWRISPFNNDFNKDLDDDDKQDYVFLIVPKIGAAIETLNTDTETESFLVCSFPLIAIQSMKPHKKITFIAKGGENFEMVLYKIIIDDDMDGKIVKTKPNSKAGEKPIYDSELPIKGFNLKGQAFEKFIGIISKGDLIRINVTVSKDPLSC